MTSVPVTAVPSRLDSLVELSALEPIFFESKSECVAVMISPDRYEQLMDALETLEDIASLDELMNSEQESETFTQKDSLFDLTDPGNAELVAEIRKELGLD
jgi:PHD/YefM family antitoxin component YafN of YafNO toxin-antitoxin module